MTQPAEFARVALSHLDELWFQVAGTRCNLECVHCFISCSPHNDAFGFLSRAQVQRHLADSLALGVKEYYFTGGEPFLNPELVDILCDTLALGPATVLTNATVLKPAWLERLRAAEAAGPYSLEFRVSLDGFTPQTNDPLRGEGVFARTLRGIQQLVAFGFLPIVTAARTWPVEDDSQVVGGFLNMLRGAGYARPRLKILPTLRLGAEIQRSGDYVPDERVRPESFVGFDVSSLLCEHSRTVTDRGVHVCPLLIEQPDALLGDSLATAAQSFELRHGACYTCYQFGALCSNPSSARAFNATAQASRDVPRV